MNWIENHFVPFAAKLGSQRHLAAIRDGFVAFMPLMIAGAFAVLINNLILGGAPDPSSTINFGLYQFFQDSTIGEWILKLKDINGNVWYGTIAVTAIFLPIAVSYNLAKSREKDGLASALIAIAAFVIILPQVVTVGEAEAWGVIPVSMIGAEGMFAALFVSLTATELFCWLTGNKRLEIRMPDTVPPAVSRSFAALLPGIITLFTFAIAQFIAVQVTGLAIPQLILMYVQEPISFLAQGASGIVFALFYVFFVHILWFLGLHGPNILAGIADPIYLPALLANIDAIQAGAEATNIFTKSFFDAFVFLGGAGATLPLLVAVFVASKREDYRTIAKLSIAPAVFQINEPVMFGMPIVLNPTLLIPFVTAPLVLTVIAWAAMAFGFVPMTQAIIPWITPPVLSGLFVTNSLMGALLGAVNLVVAFFIYYPFVIAANKEVALTEQAK
ncbi:MAG: PTS sugar transporter subunit IIC [Culicoidibacterales bacterium]